MREHGSLPRARQEGLLEEPVGEELLLYDQDSHTAHCLSPVAACVWRHCDGKHDLAELATLAGVSERSVAYALHALREKELLDGELAFMQNTDPGVSRRQAIGRIARYSAAAAAPFVVSATAATPAMAASTGCKNGEGCVEADAICCCCSTGEGRTGAEGETCEALCKKFGETAQGAGLTKRRFSA